MGCSRMRGLVLSCLMLMLQHNLSIKSWGEGLPEGTNVHKVHVSPLRQPLAPTKPVLR